MVAVGGNVCGVGDCAGVVRRMMKKKRGKCQNRSCVNFTNPG